jgi:carbamoyl-phosphate synthase large subunit
MEANICGLDDVKINCINPDERKKLIIARLKIAEPNRILLIAQAFREGISLEEIKIASGFEPWFLDQLSDLVEIERKILKNGLPETGDEMLALKKLGFADKRLAKLSNKTEKEVYDIRINLNVKPIYKRVDSCAGEFDSSTSYMYSCYES